MSDSTRYARGSIDELRASVEREKLQTTLSFYNEASEFLRFDREMNLQLLRITRTIADAIEANPEGLFRSEGSTVAEALSTLRQQQGGGGADVIGGAPEWIDDIERIVKIFTGPVAEEKAFFLSIIKLVFCGC
jgi:hypothetical protein